MGDTAESSTSTTRLDFSSTVEVEHGLAAAEDPHDHEDHERQGEELVESRHGFAARHPGRQ